MASKCRGTASDAIPFLADERLEHHLALAAQEGADNGHHFPSSPMDLARTNHLLAHETISLAAQLLQPGGQYIIGWRQPLIDHKRESLALRRLVQNRWDEIAVHVRALLHVAQLRFSHPEVFGRRLICTCLASFFRAPEARQPADRERARSSYAVPQRSICANLDLLFEVFPSCDPMLSKRVADADRFEQDMEWAETQWKIVYHRVLWGSRRSFPAA
eukprot:TRINITY_DN49606_c0_g1_i1.p1 TRINITY_DN49606_c0_g1~~TRINITY_DN49606_c0_g1_i1.p1  ORF type:complete len:217 (-),score=33.62 TRINITY_DN49606_c0_g1_i1:9-659(-)